MARGVPKEAGVLLNPRVSPHIPPQAVAPINLTAMPSRCPKPPSKVSG